MLLAADIGATKTILAFFSSEQESYSPLYEREVTTAGYPDLDALVLSFLNETGLSIDRAVFGIAAPVKCGRAVMINMPWTVDEEHLKKTLCIERVHLLNDLEAIANSIPILRGNDLYTLNKGIPQPGAPMAVIAPGTGLGEAFLIADGKDAMYRGLPSEGGHVDFAPTDVLEMDLLNHLRKKYDHVSYERLCSGPGIHNIYEFLKKSLFIEEPGWLAEELARVDDPTPVIVHAAMDKKKRCRICEMALDIFTSILGSEAGNLALKVLAVNGVYIAGGISPRILDVLRTGNFMERFKQKGRESFIVEDIPVHVILNNRAGLLGAAAYGLGRIV